MYKVFVPVMNSNVNKYNRETVLKMLKNFDAKRVFLALDFYEFDSSKHNAIFETLKENCEFFKSNGFEVGAWFWAFETGDVKTNYVNMRTVSGKEKKSRICPLDVDFVRFSQSYMKNIAKCNVDIIMFDDDFGYTFMSETPGCLCDRHIEMINQITGEKNNRETLADYILNGGKNKYRDAWLKVNGNALRSFSKAARQAVDEINPDIRIGFCACMTSWDIDGTTPDELSRILAGKTKPFYRFIGAPYWAVRSSFGCYLQDVIELERMESAWTRRPDIEVFAEGDAFPRPRNNCPASYIEGFDTAIRASGCTDGILKYGIDYTSNPEYETGYAAFHQRNRQLYNDIDRLFSDKKHCGIRVYESMHKIAELETQTSINKSVNFEYLFQSKAARTLAHNTIPSTYEGEGVCGIVFDENARNLPLSALKNGLIIDIQAAEILSSRGVDVGIKKFGNECYGNVEHVIDTNNNICHYFDVAPTYDNEFSENIKVLSTVKTDRGDIPASYLYENDNGNRFLVFNFNSRPDGEDRRKNTYFGPQSVFRCYERSRQIAKNVEWLSGKKLPAYVYGHPSLYIQCKENADSLSVGLWNFFADVAINPVVELSEKYSDIEFVNCNGQLDGDKVKLTDIAAFDYAFINLRR